MGLAPETVVSPLAQAPPDRPSTTIEDWARQGVALLFGDRILDMNERRIVYGLMQEIALRAQNGGVGNGGTPPTEMAAEAPAPSPMEMNQNTSDYGSGMGEPMGDEGGY